MQNQIATRWQPGDSILKRDVWRDRVWYAQPLTVVEDTPERLLVLMRAGTPIKWTMIDFDTGLFDGPLDHVWNRTDALMIVEEGARHEVWAMWAAGGGPFLGWYVNLQDPLRRVAGGFDTWDRSLDIVVEPDLRWQWKDEDHFARIQELGWISTMEAAAIWREGERVIRRIEGREAPFCEPWPQWQPDPDWPLPTLPSTWAELNR